MKLAEKKIRKNAAIVTVFDAAKMSRVGCKTIAAWLRKQAKWVEQNAAQLSSRYRATYTYEDAERDEI